jgi:hypothetical protein
MGLPEIETCRSGNNPVGMNFFASCSTEPAGEKRPTASVKTSRCVAHVKIESTTARSHLAKATQDRTAAYQVLKEVKPFGNSSAVDLPAVSPRAGLDNAYIGGTFWPRPEP